MTLRVPGKRDERNRSSPQRGGRCPGAGGSDGHLGGPQTTHLDCMEEALPISVTCPGLEQCCESTWPEPHVLPKAGEAGLGVDPKGCQRWRRQGSVSDFPDDPLTMVTFA